MSDIKNKVIEEVKKIYDPEIPVNIYELGLIYKIEVDEKKPVLICVPNGIASAHVNPTKEISKIIVLADIAWKPNDNEMVNVEFENYDWNKWK